MKEKTYKIFNIVNDYKEYFKKNIVIIDEKKLDIDFELNSGKLGHLMGLHKMDYKNKASRSILGIINSELSDQEILDNVYNIQKEILKDGYLANEKVKTVKERCNEIDYALKNLHKAYIVKAKLPDNSEMNSLNFIVQTKDNRYLQIGIAKDNTNEYYLETFIIRKDKRYFDDATLNSKILGIYERNRNNNLIPFSFNKELNNKLENKYFEDSKNFNYLEIVKEYEKVKDNKEVSKWKNQTSKENLER